MPGPPDETHPSARDQARRLLGSIDAIGLDRYTVVGNYVRFDDRVRGHLKESRQRIVQSFSGQARMPTNLLLWGVPGSGKSYLLNQIARGLQGEVEYREFNLAQLDEAAFQSELEEISSIPRPVLCFIDEIDSKPAASWPYEVLLPHLEPSVPRAHRTSFCLAGSGGSSLEEMKDRIRLRPKGPDLLNRIPRGNEFVVDPLGVGDKVLVSLAQLLSCAHEEGRVVREVEKLALYYIAVGPAFTSARQLRSLASECAKRLPPGEDRIKYDHLFRAGDPENKEFWRASGAARARLADTFVHVSGGDGLGDRPETASLPTPLVRNAQGPTNPVLRIAVLPFTNMNADPHDEFFSDGLTEEMIGELAKVGGLRVIARTSVMRFRGSTKGISEIASELKVGSVLEGSVRRAGNRIRVTATLIDAQSEEPLWSGQYEDEITDVFAIQSAIAGKVAAALHVALPVTPGPRREPTSDPEAYKAYLLGRYMWNRRTPDSVRAALRHFEDAIRMDPLFANPYSGVADCYSILVDRGLLRPDEGLPKARVAAQRALQIDEGLPEAHASLGLILEKEADWKGSEREYLRALGLNPMNAPARLWYYILLTMLGRTDEAVEQLHRAEEADPLSPTVLLHLGNLDWLQGRLEDAVSTWDRAIELGADRGVITLFKTTVLVRTARREEALSLLREMGQFPESYIGNAWEPMVQAILGMREEALAGIERLQSAARDSYVPSAHIAWVYGALGDADMFYEWAFRSAREGGPDPLWIILFPFFEGVRQDPRYREYLARCKLPERPNQPQPDIG